MSRVNVYIKEIFYLPNVLFGPILIFAWIPKILEIILNADWGMPSFKVLFSGSIFLYGLGLLMSVLFLIQNHIVEIIEKINQ
jgi:hypothetical protein